VRNYHHGLFLQPRIKNVKLTSGRYRFAGDVRAASASSCPGSALGGCATHTPLFRELNSPGKLDLGGNITLAETALDQVQTLQEWHLKFVYRQEQPRSGINHRAAELVQQEPCGLVAAEPDLRLRLDILVSDALVDTQARDPPVI
jgi:hypothetical protein